MKSSKMSLSLKKISFSHLCQKRSFNHVPNSKIFLKHLPKNAKIVEVGLRDGLQNEKKIVSTEAKLELLDKLYQSGLRNIEVGSFVSPKWVPQMGDTTQLFEKLNKVKETKYPEAIFSALTPNVKGLESALKLNVQEIAIFGAASESFSQKNINCSIEESLQRFKDVCELAIKTNPQIRIRGYISCILGCPYEGKTISPLKVLELSQRLLDMGCYEISLGDTIGIGSPGTTLKLLDTLIPKLPTDRLAVHFHNTYGQALSNIAIALQYGISTIDSSVSGLGGCPYAKGASGNVSTEDVVYLLNEYGITHNYSLPKIIEAGEFIDSVLERNSESKVALVYRKKN